MFAGVDCSGGCGETGSWYELHSLIWEATTPRLGFGVWYFRLDGPNAPVYVSHGILLPDVVPIADTFPNASWTMNR